MSVDRKTAGGEVRGLKHPSMCECVRCCDMDALRDNPLHGRERAEWLKSLDPQRKQRERW